jgi:hydroxyethylthiazole kinase-like sugar kinase family protein
MIDTDEIRAKVASASPGPWILDPVDPTYVARKKCLTWHVIANCRYEGDEEDWRANAAFIVYAHGAMPAMADEIDRLREDIRRLEMSHRSEAAP